MPQIGLHMVIASEVAETGDIPLLRDCSGAFVLGSTTPDIRLLTRQDRKVTHFFDLDIFDEQDSLGNFFAQHTALAHPDALSPETRAWVCGYIIHLVTDEAYINGIYRRFFGSHDALGGTLRANAMDRILQFHLDNTYCDPMHVREHLSDTLRMSTAEINAVFLEPDLLAKWHKLTSDVAAGGMEPGRMQSMMSNFLKAARLDEEQRAAFLEELPNLLHAALEHVGAEELDGFLAGARAAGANAVLRYLEGAWKEAAEAEAAAF